MMRHEEERFHMSIEDSMALKIRDEPKRLLELERLRREDERQQMYEGEMSQIAVEEKTVDEKLKLCEWKKPKSKCLEKMRDLLLKTAVHRVVCN